MTVRIASSNLSICPMYEELGFLVPGNFAGDGNRFRLRLFDNGGFLGTFSFDGPSVISFRHVLVWHLYHPLLFYPLFKFKRWLDMEGNVISLRLWEVYQFFWGTAVRERRSGKWIRAFLSPSGQEIDLSDVDAEIHENGIEFL